MLLEPPAHMPGGVGGIRTRNPVNGMPRVLTMPVGEDIDAS